MALEYRITTTKWSNSYHKTYGALVTLPQIGTYLYKLDYARPKWTQHVYHIFIETHIMDIHIDIDLGISAAYYCENTFLSPKEVHPL